jgi:MerR family transcriptional regulator, light-induced transcriptional regulator
VTALVSAARTVGADAVVLAATRPTALTAHSTSLARLAEDHPVHIAGRGADEEVARVIGARLLPADPVEALAHLGPRETAPA